jgi:hypothetical protein
MKGSKQNGVDMLWFENEEGGILYIYAICKSTRNYQKERDAWFDFVNDIFSFEACINYNE